MAAHQFTFTGTRERQIQRKRTKVTTRVNQLAATLTQETLERVLADVADPVHREAILLKLRPALLFVPHENTLIRAFVQRAIRDENHLYEAVLSVAREERQGALDLIAPALPFTPSAGIQQLIAEALPSAIVAPDGRPADVTPAIHLTDLTCG
jgi:hypothetical protein